MGRSRRLVVLSLAASLVVASQAFAQSRPVGLPRVPPRRPPAPEGRRIDTADGDTVIVDGDDRVRMLRRRLADVRVVVDPQARSIVVMADWGAFDHPGPNGGVDHVWRFDGVGAAWPLDARWQGVVTLFELVPLRDSAGLGGDPLLLETPAGRVAFRAGSDPTPADERIVVTFTGMKSGGRDGLSFDDAERDARSPSAMWSMSTMDFGRSGPGTRPFSGGVLSGVTAGAEVGLAGGASRPAGPIPIALRRVDPVFPDPAAMPGVTGVITVRMTIAATGSVRDVAIVQGIPALNELALTAARQWQFNTGSDGRPFTITWPYPMRRQ